MIRLPHALQQSKTLLLMLVCTGFGLGKHLLGGSELHLRYDHFVFGIVGDALVNNLPDVFLVSDYVVDSPDNP